MMKSSSTTLPSLRLGRPHPGAELKCMNEIEKKADKTAGRSRSQGVIKRPVSSVSSAHTLILLGYFPILVAFTPHIAFGLFNPPPSTTASFTLSKRARPQGTSRAAWGPCHVESTQKLEACHLLAMALNWHPRRYGLLRSIAVYLIFFLSDMGLSQHGGDSPKWAIIVVLMVNSFEKVMLAPCDAREKLSDSRGFDTDRMVPGPVLMILMSSQGM